MKKTAFGFVCILLLAEIVMIAYAPDTLSIIIIATMCLISWLGVVFGVIPLLSYAAGFRKGQKNIENAQEVQTDIVWLSVEQNERFMEQKFLDKQFSEFKEKVKQQRALKQIACDVEDYINEDTIALQSWQSVVDLIPGIMTSLGILGTFIGLIIGIGGISISTVEATMESVRELLDGIKIAFYTSISGVIFSIVFNIIHKISWNVMSRELGLFVEHFHRDVIPSVEEQSRYRERKEVAMILDRLDRLPKNTGFSLSKGGNTASESVDTSNEQILMPQILSGLKSGEFFFYLQPRFDLSTQRITGAEALVRWKHAKLGIISPAVFVPILEKNGYIAKLDQYIWESVCKTIRKWIDSGKRVVPISVNVSKTDVFALDLMEFFDLMIQKYRIPPRYLEIEIAENAYTEAKETVMELTSALRAKGFRVVLDGFDGNFFQLESVLQSEPVDILKLDLRYIENENITSAFEQARTLNLDLLAEGIENMDQIKILRKSGCSEGQGYYFSKPVSLEEFEETIAGDKRA